MSVFVYSQICFLMGKGTFSGIEFHIMKHVLDSVGVLSGSVRRENHKRLTNTSERTHKDKKSRLNFTVDLKGHKFSSSTFFPPVRNELLPLVSNYWHLMPPITSTFEAFSSGQRHSRCVYSARKKTKLTRSPISNLRGDLGGSCGDREVLNLLQNLLLLPLLTCRLVGLEVKARIGILSPVKMKEMKFLNPSILNTFLSVCMRFIRTSNAIWVRSWEARTSKKHPVA